MKKNQPVYKWDAENGIATFTLTDGHNKFIGVACCHDDDHDMMNEHTGMILAQIRAEIKYYIHIKNNEIKPALKALKQLYYSINRSKQYDKHHYESRMLYRQITLKEDELNFVVQEIKERKKYITNLIAEKELFYQRVRANRTETNSVKND